MSDLSSVPLEGAVAGGEIVYAEMIHRATEVIGSEAEALRWLGTPVRMLNYATPISLFHEAGGREAVLNVLGRLEHGVL